MKFRLLILLYLEEKRKIYLFFEKKKNKDGNAFKNVEYVKVNLQIAEIGKEIKKEEQN